MPNTQLLYTAFQFGFTFGLEQGSATCLSKMPLQPCSFVLFSYPSDILWTSLLSCRRCPGSASVVYTWQPCSSAGWLGLQAVGQALQPETSALGRSLSTAEEMQKAGGWCPPKAVPVPNTHLLPRSNSAKGLLSCCWQATSLCSISAGASKESDTVHSCPMGQQETQWDRNCTQRQESTMQMKTLQQGGHGLLGNPFMPLAGDMLMLPSPAALISFYYTDILKYIGCRRMKCGRTQWQI